MYGAGGVEPQGIANQAGVQVLASTANGTALTNFSKILDAILAVESKGYSPTGVIMSPRECRTINGFTDTTGQPLRVPGNLQNLPLLVSPKVPVNQTQGTAPTASTILVGDFSKALVGVRSPLRVEVLKENYAENLQYGFLFWLRMDVAVTEANAFAKVTGVIYVNPIFSNPGGRGNSDFHARFIAPPPRPPGRPVEARRGQGGPQAARLPVGP